MHEIFHKTKVAEKVREDLKILEVYHKRIEKILEPSRSRETSLISNFYSSQLCELIKNLGSIVENFFNEFSTLDNAPVAYEKYFMDIAKLHENIKNLTEYYTYLDRAIRHRSTLFNKRLELFHPAHYVFEPLYKVLISSDALSWESIEKSALQGFLFLMSFFGESEAATFPTIAMIPEKMFKEYAKDIFNRLKNLYSSSFSQGRRKMDKVKILGFISIPRHAHTHSRCLIIDVHEVMHNILYLLLYSCIFKDQLVHDNFEALCKGFINFIKEYSSLYLGKNTNSVEKLRNIKPHMHVSELLCDLSATALSGFAYPLSLLSSDVYHFTETRISCTHPPDVIRSFVCLDYANNIMQLKLRNRLNNMIEGVLDLSWKYISSYEFNRYYLSFIIEQYGRISRIVKRVVRFPFNEGDLNNSLQARDDLINSNPGNIFKRAEDGEYTPITLMNAIWLKRLNNGSLTDPNVQSKTGAYELEEQRYTVHILIAMKRWLEEQVIKPIIP